VAEVQYTFTHKQYTERNTHNNKKKFKKFGKCGPCPVFASYTLEFALQLRKEHRKTSVVVVEECPDNSVAVVQYTFTHKQYTEQHNETEYTER
jgi:quinolinate synthase